MSANLQSPNPLDHARFHQRAFGCKGKVVEAWDFFERDEGRRESAGALAK